MAFSGCIEGPLEEEAYENTIPESITITDYELPDENKAVDENILEGIEGSSSVELEVNQRNYVLKEGQGLVIAGLFEYKGMLKLKVETVSEKNGEFYAELSLIDEGTVLDRKSFKAGEEVLFFDSEGNQIRIDAFIEVLNVFSKK